MSASETDVLDRIRDHFRHVIEARDHLHQKLETIMQYLPDLIAMGKSLMAERDGLLTDRDAEKARADSAEKERDDLKAQIATDEASAKDALTTLSTEVDAEKPKTAPVVTTSPSGATVTVDSTVGTATHADPISSITTTVPLDGSAPTAVDTSTMPATPVTPPTPAVAEATSAASAAGVTVPAAS